MTAIFSYAAPLYLLAVAYPLIRADIKFRRLPNKYVLPAIPIALIGQGIDSIITQTWMPALISVGIAAASFGVGLGINYLGSLGMGDVKLITAIALALGWFNWSAPLMAMFYAFAIAAIVIVIGLIAQRTKLQSTIPLGPYLLLGFGAAFTQMLI